METSLGRSVVPGGVLSHGDAHAIAGGGGMILLLYLFSFLLAPWAFAVTIGMLALKAVQSVTHLRGK